MDRIEVVSAVIIRDGRVLLTQRDPARADFGLLWECPGGKVNHGELYQWALRRELLEEIDVVPIIHDEIQSYEIDPPLVRAPLLITFYRCSIGTRKPFPREVVGLGWFGRDEVLRLPMTPGNDRFRSTLADLVTA